MTIMWKVLGLLRGFSGVQGRRYFLLVFGFGIDSSTLLGESPVPDCCVAVSRTGCIKCSALTTPAEVATAPNLS